MGNIGQQQQQQNVMINQTQAQNHSQSPQNQYPTNQITNNDGNFKKNRPSGQGTPTTSNNSINTNSQVSQNSQQMTAVGTGSNYIPNSNQVNQPSNMSTPNNSNHNIPVQQQTQQQTQQQIQQMQQQGSKIS